MLFNPNTMLYDGKRAFRASEYGIPVFGTGIKIGILWLPDIRVGYDVPVMTHRGRIWSHQVVEGDWLIFPRHQMPDFDAPDSDWIHVNDDTHRAYCILKKLFEQHGASLTDMMDCPDHIADWRKDTWMITPRALQSYDRYHMGESWDSIYLRVFDVDDEMGGLVDVQVPVVEAYGITL